MAGSINEHRESRFARFFAKERMDLFSIDLYRACAAEFLGVLLLTFLGVGTAVSNPGDATAASLEAGFFIGCAISILSTVSGGHINPAISVGFLVLGQITVIRFIFYCVIQTLGSASGMALLKTLVPANTTHMETLGVIYPAPGVNDSQALVCEMIITFFLLFGTFAMIDPHRNDINGFAPFQIGLLVTTNIYAAFNLSGGCMNPARNFGPAIVAGRYEKMWIYWVGDMSGAMVGALLYDKVFSTRVCRHWLKTDCRKCQEEDGALSNEKKLYVKNHTTESDHEML